MKKLIGCGTALITPFNEKGFIDFLRFEKLIERQIINNIDFLVILGTTGEASCLTNKEKFKLLETAVIKVNKRIPIIAGVSSNSTQIVIDNIKMCEKLAIDSYLISAPYYNKPTQLGLYRHFKSISETTNKPIVLYNVPSRTSVNIEAKTCIQLAKIENIIAIKEASSNFQQIYEIIRNVPENFSILSGNDNEALALISSGCHGLISVASNIAPIEVGTLVKNALQNDIIHAKNMHYKLLDLFSSCFLETNPIPVKAGLFKMGMIKNVLRPPLYKSSTKTIKHISKIIKNLGLIHEYQ